jgi:hypothetical protein
VGLAEAEGLIDGEGDALADGLGVTGGVGEGVGVGPSAFAYAGKVASSAKPSKAPSRSVRSIHPRDCTRALIHRMQVHPTDERSARYESTRWGVLSTRLLAARFLDLPAIYP